MKKYIQKYLGIKQIDDFNVKLFDIVMSIGKKVFKNDEKQFVDFLESKQDIMEFAARVNEEILIRAINKADNREYLNNLVQLKQNATNVVNQLKDANKKTKRK